jgi:hypothetical protein
MLSKARGSVTWWKTQNNLIPFIYIYLASQGYLPIGHPTILKIHND